MSLTQSQAITNKINQANGRIRTSTRKISAEEVLQSLQGADLSQLEGEVFGAAGKLVAHSYPYSDRIRWTQARIASGKLVILSGRGGYAATQAYPATASTVATFDLQ